VADPEGANPAMAPHKSWEWSLPPLSEEEGIFVPPASEVLDPLVTRAAWASFHSRIQGFI